MIKLKKMRVCFLTLYIAFNILYPKIYLFDAISLLLIIGYFFSNLKNIKKIKKYIPQAVLVLLFYFIPSMYYSTAKSTIFNFIDFFIRISPIIIGINELDFAKQEYNVLDYKKIRIIIIVLLLYVSIVNIYYLNINPYFARTMANYNYDIPGLSTVGTLSGGGYYIIYGFIYLMCYLVESLFIKKNSKNKLVYLLLMIIISICVVKANFATAFIMLIASILILLFVENLKKNKLIALTLLLIALISVIYYKDFAMFAVNKLPTDSIISIRLQDAINNTNDSTAYERFYLLQKSLNTIKSNFIIGISAKNNHDYYEISKKAGLHTEWLDFVARYGIVLAITYYYFIYKSFKKMILNIQNKNLYVSLFISILILGFLNPILNAGCYFMIFLIIPILIKGDEYEKNV